MYQNSAPEKQETSSGVKRTATEAEQQNLTTKIEGTSEQIEESK
jgi:hypothetical protein